jgi:pimeloyl-ACP methyl ester carboxylesterase
MTLSKEYLAAIAAHAGIDLDLDVIKPPFERFVMLNGLRMCYLEWGGPDARPLVLLHGGGQSAHTWDALCLAMGPRFRCIALDQRGHGNSQWSEAGEYKTTDHARDIAAFVDALDLKQPILVGMSLGGINATAYAASTPGRLGGLVCVDIGPEAQFEPVDRLMRGLNDYRSFSSPEDAATQLARMGARRELGLLRDTLALNLRRNDDGTWTWKYDPRTLVGLTAQEIMDARRPLWDVLHRISCPVLIARGADSEIFSEQNADRFSRALPEGKWVTVPRARHSVQTDNPTGLAEVVQGFADFVATR